MGLTSVSGWMAGVVYFKKSKHLNFAFFPFKTLQRRRHFSQIDQTPRCLERLLKSGLSWKTFGS